MRQLSDFLAVVLGTTLFAGFIAAGACIPNPTNPECHRKADCLSCVEAFCSWCGPRPGVSGSGPASAASCFSREVQPTDCDPPPHYAFCYGGSTDPIDNRMYLKRPKVDGGADASK